jgi:hypothetical protein
LLRQPRVEHADTSGALEDSKGEWSSQVVDLLILTPFVLLFTTSILRILVSRGILASRSKKQ